MTGYIPKVMVVTLLVLFVKVPALWGQFLSDTTTKANTKNREELINKLRQSGSDFVLIERDSASMGKIDTYDSGFFHLQNVMGRISVDDTSLLGLEMNGNYAGKGAITGVECAFVVALFQVISHLHGDSGGYPPLVGGLFSFVFYGIPLTGLGALIGSAFSNNTFYPIGLLR